MLKKTKKIILIGLSFVLAFCVFSFSTFADTNPSFNIVSDLYGDVYFIVYGFDDDNGYHAIDISSVTITPVSRGYSIRFYGDFYKTSGMPLYYEMNLSFYIRNTSLLDGNNQLKNASCLIGFSNDYYDMWQSNPYGEAKTQAFTYYDKNSNGALKAAEGSVTYPNTSYTEYGKFDFAPNPVGGALDHLECDVVFGKFTNSSYLEFALYDFNYDIINFYDAQTNKLINNNNANTKKITDNNNANTDRIIQSQEDLQQNEKNEASSGGNSNVNGLTSAIPTQSNAGLITALTSLANSMVTTNTSATLTFPAMTIPAIDGLFDSVTLNQPLTIDFGTYIRMIPDKIMTLIKSLLTIALIVFCVKELYSMISYVLTLKGGSADE